MGEIAVNLSSVIDIGLGLILVYYVVCTIVQSIVNFASSLLNMGSEHLAASLRDMLADAHLDKQFSDHVLIKNLERNRTFFFGLIQRTGVDYIPNQTFALTLFDILAHRATGDEQTPLQALQQAATTLPDGKTKDSLIALLSNGENTIEKAQQRVAEWFDNTMLTASDLYTAQIRRIALIVAGLLTVILGIDSVNIATTLWQQPTIRAAAAAEAADMAQHDQLNLQSAGQTQDALGQLEALRIPLFWDFNNLPNTSEKWLWKIIGLVITWIAATLGAPFWYDVLKKVNPAP